MGVLGSTVYSGSTWKKPDQLNHANIVFHIVQSKFFKTAWLRTFTCNKIRKVCLRWHYQCNWLCGGQGFSRNGGLCRPAINALLILPRSLSKDHGAERGFGVAEVIFNSRTHVVVWAKGGNSSVHAQYVSTCAQAV